MKYINCIICSSNNHKIFFKNKSDNFIKLFNKDEFISQKVVCKSCGLVYQNPIFTEEELAHIYTNGAGMRQENNLAHPTERYLIEKEYRASDQIRWLEKFIGLDVSGGSPNVKRALEIGSSAGIFLNKLQKRGWQVEGIEPFRHFAEYAKNNFGIKVYPCFFKEIELEKASYDFIILSHVLEHIPDPISTLSKLGSYLKPNGFLFVEIPNIKGIWKNLNDQLQSSHLFVPSVNTMQQLVAKAGLKVYKMETKGRIIRCILTLPNNRELVSNKLPVSAALKSDNYKILSLRLKIQQLSSWLFRIFPLGVVFRGEFLLDTVIFTASNFTVTIFSFISSFIIRRVLGPITMGLYAELMLILEYCRFHHLGMVNALEREIPFYIGKNELKKVEEIKKTSLAFIALTALNVTAILFIISFFGDVHKVGLRFVAMLVFLESIISFYEALLQSYKRFKLWSLLLTTIGFLDVLLKIFFVIKFGLNGLLSAMVFTGVITIAAYHFWGKCRVELTAKIYLKEIAHLLKLGIPLIFFRIMYMFSLSIDRLAIIFFLGRLQLGYYSIATMVLNYLILLPKFIYRPLYPKFMEAFGKNEDTEDIKRYLIVPNRIFACLYSVLIGLVVITIPFIVIYLLPRFKEGIFAAQIVAFAAFFSALIYTWNFLLIALYEQKRLVLLYGISAIINIVVTLFFIKVLHMQINGVALATLIGQFMFTTLLICYGYRYYTKNLSDHLKLLFILYYPFLWIVVAMLGVKFYYPRQISFKADLFSTILGCIVFLTLCAPLMYYVIKKERLFHYMFNFDKEK